MAWEPHVGRSLRKGLLAPAGPCFSAALPQCNASDISPTCTGGKALPDKAVSPPKPLWLRDMYLPLHSIRKKSMAQKLYDRESSDEEEIFNRADVR
uniref:Uncharacterized protein n=1 Tax=Terrapene triunguis TaxID=2587831 RepID=A0A674IXD3_9SAUR